MISNFSKKIQIFACMYVFIDLHLWEHACKIQKFNIKHSFEPFLVAFKYYGITDFAHHTH